MWQRLAALAVLVLAFSQSAMAIEQPKYRVIKTYSDFELREYAPYLVAETTVTGDFEKAGDEAFKILAGYIFGKNTSKTSIAMTAPVTQSQKIAMTAPVTQTGANGAWTFQFMMPSAWTLQTLPVPNDPRVHLKAVEAKRVAVRRYKGSWTKKAYDENLAALEAGLTREKLSAAGAPVWARYDPPFIPWFLKTNEIQIPLAP